MAAVNNMNQNIHATQEALQQFLANQRRQPQGLSSHKSHKNQNIQANQQWPSSKNPCNIGSAMSIKNGARASKETTELEKAETLTLNMLKTFRGREAAQRINFVGRLFDTITQAKFIDVFSDTYYPEQICEQKCPRVHEFEVRQRLDSEGM